MKRKLLGIGVATAVMVMSMNPTVAMASGTDFIKGCDISSIISYENSGQKFGYENGYKEDSLTILKNYGVNFFRIRIWNNPYDEEGNSYGGGNTDLNNAVELGKRAANLGIPVLIDFQYSDFWADPAAQYAPKEWINYSKEEKSKAIYDFTYNSLRKLLNSGVDVQMVQVGNETNGSMCGMGGLFDGTWDLSTGVGDGMKSGCRAIDDINAEFGIDIQKALHFTDPITNAEWYVDQATKQNIDFDIVAVSAYPFWFGHADDLADTLKKIAKKYNKKVMVAETAYPYTYNNSDDTHNNINSDSDMTCKDYDISVAGQEEAILDIYKAVESVNEQEGTEGYGLGAFYWEPALIGTSIEKSNEYGTGWAKSYASSYEKYCGSNENKYPSETKGSSWDNNTLFDADGNALSSIQAFRNMRMNGWSWKFSGALYDGIGMLNECVKKNGIEINASDSKNVTLVKKYEKFEGEDYDGYLSLNGGGDKNSRNVAIEVKGDSEIEVVASGDSDRILIFAADDGNVIDTKQVGKGMQKVKISYVGGSGKIYLYSKSKSINLYKVELSY